MTKCCIVTVFFAANIFFILADFSFKPRGSCPYKNDGVACRTFLGAKFANWFHIGYSPLEMSQYLLGAFKVTISKMSKTVNCSYFVTRKAFIFKLFGL